MKGVMILIKDIIGVENNFIGLYSLSDVQYNNIINGVLERQYQYLKFYVQEYGKRLVIKEYMVAIK